MLAITKVEGERVAVIFPCIDHNGELYDATVVTVNDEENPCQNFTVRRVNSRGEQQTHHGESFDSFPAAIRAARKSVGWG